MRSSDTLDLIIDVVDQRNTTPLNVNIDCKFYLISDKTAGIFQIYH